MYAYDSLRKLLQKLKSINYAILTELMPPYTEFKSENCTQPENTTFLPLLQASV